MSNKSLPNSHELVLRDEDFIVSKTDAVGRLTYCNPVFIEFSGYTEADLLGKQHNVIRHPDMPRTIFALLWQTIRNGEEFIGYIKNMSKDGSYYWVLATVTPTFKPNSQEIIGYFSVRRKPLKAKIASIEPLYLAMLAAEQHAGRLDAIAAGNAVLQAALEAEGKDYREYILTL